MEHAVPQLVSGDRLAEIDRLRVDLERLTNRVAHTRADVEAAVKAGLSREAIYERELEYNAALQKMNTVEELLTDKQADAMAEWAIAACAEAAVRHGTTYTGLFDRKLTSVVRGTVRRWRKADTSQGPPSKEKVTTFATELGIDMTEPYRIYGWALPTGYRDRGPTAPTDVEPEQIRELKRRLADPSVAADRKQELLRRLRWLLIEDAAEAVSPMTGSLAKSTPTTTASAADALATPTLGSGYLDAGGYLDDFGMQSSIRPDRQSTSDTESAGPDAVNS